MGPITVVSIEEPLKTVQFGKERHFAVPGWLLSTLLTLSVGFVWAYLQGNTFPAMWHPDEPSKVHQIITNERDYYHPLLLLRATQLALAFTGARPTSEPVVLAGRQVSPVSAGLAVLALGIAAARLN